MTVLRVTVPDQYFCTKHPDLNITAREKKSKAGTGVPAYGEIFTSGQVAGRRWDLMEQEEFSQTGRGLFYGICGREGYEWGAGGGICKCSFSYSHIQKQKLMYWKSYTVLHELSLLCIDGSSNFRRHFKGVTLFAAYLMSPRSLR